MIDIVNSLKSIEESLKQSMHFYEANKKVFSEVYQNMKHNNSNNYFEDFDLSNIFEKCESENLNENQKNDSIANLMKAEKHLNGELESLEKKRNLIHQEYMNNMRSVSKELQAIGRIKYFIKYWNSKLSDDYQLKEYPCIIKDSFESIPAEKQSEIVKLISVVKHFQFNEDLSEHKSILNESNWSNIFNKNAESTDEDNQTVGGSSKSRISMDLGDDHSLSTVSLPEELKNAIPRRAYHYIPGNTDDMGLSILNFTVIDKTESANISRQDDKVVNQSSQLHANQGANKNLDSPIIDVGKDYFDYKVPELDLDESNISDGPLNKAVDCIDDYDDEDNIKGREPELPSFLEDSARIPEIEKATVGDGNSWSQVQFDHSIFCSMNVNNIQDNSVQLNEDSTFYSDKSLLEMQLDNMQDLSDSKFDLSVADVDYSFNRSTIGYQD